MIMAEDSQPRGRGIESLLVPYNIWNVSEGKDRKEAKWGTSTTYN